jgi:Fe-S cluster assembly protein SufD
MSSSRFSPDAARRLPGPPWLVERRVVAAERVAAAPMPTAEEEVWRYSRIGELDLERFAPVLDAAAEGPGPAHGDGAGLAPHAARVVVVDGHVISAELSPELAAAGAFVGRLLDRPDAEAIAATAPAPTDVFAELNDAFAPDPVVVSVPAGLRVELPVVVQHHTTGGGSAVFTRLFVRVGDNASVDVLDEQRSDDDVLALAVPFVHLDVARGAHLGYCSVQQLGSATWQLCTQVATVGADGSVVASTAALGGDYSRVRTDCKLVGAGASGDLVSLYFGNRDQMLDFRTFQDHAAPNTTSNLVFKGVVDDHSRSVYTGLIRVRKNARGTNAFQTNRNLKLSDDAWAESVPNLEIENNDVRCSHASTVGPIDEDQRFYLESRGVPPEAAERLVVAGFFAEVLERLPVAAAVPGIRAQIASKLDEHMVTA